MKEAEKRVDLEALRKDCEADLEEAVRDRSVIVGEDADYAAVLFRLHQLQGIMRATLGTLDEIAGRSAAEISDMKVRVSAGETLREDLERRLVRLEKDLAPGPLAATARFASRLDAVERGLLSLEARVKQ